MNRAPAGMSEPDSLDQTPPLPLTETERLHYQAEAEKGKYPTLEVVRRFIATIRTSIKNSPVKLAKTAKTRNKKTEITEDDVEDFF